MDLRSRWIRIVLVDGLLIAAVAFTIWRIASTTGSDEGAAPIERRVEVGDRLNLSGIDWGLKAKTIVLALRTTCPGCNASVSFYRALAASRPDVRILAVSPETTELLGAWLAENKIQIDGSVGGVDLVSLGLAVVPTLLIVTPEGVVSDLAAGLLDPELQQRAFARLGDRETTPINNRPYAPLIDFRVLGEMKRSGKVTLLDGAKRGEAPYSRDPNALAIPRDELAVRAPVEMDLRNPVIVDCSFGRLQMCDSAAGVLLKLGVERVFILFPRVTG